MVPVLLFVAAVVAAQQAEPPPPPPPPPPPKIEIPPTPQRIKVGCGGAQSPYMGPAEQWHQLSATLSARQVEELERVLEANPDDVCARGYLIAHGSDFARRYEHALWMIRNHPEWDGFMLNPSMSWCRSLDPRVADPVREAWLAHTTDRQRNGAVLHHAALCFEDLQPEFAEALLQRSIQIDPEEAYHVEGLGRLYGLYQRPYEKDVAFKQKARIALEASSEWLVLAGALDMMYHLQKGPARDDLAKSIQARLLALTGNQHPPGERLTLPSRSTRLNRAKCPWIRLLHYCDRDCNCADY